MRWRQELNSSGIGQPKPCHGKNSVSLLGFLKSFTILFNVTKCDKLSLRRLVKFRTEKTLLPNFSRSFPTNTHSQSTPVLWGDRRDKRTGKEGERAGGGKLWRQSSQEGGKQRHQETSQWTGRLHTLGDSLSQEEGKQRKLRDLSYPLQLHPSNSCPLHFLTVNL